MVDGLSRGSGREQVDARTECFKFFFLVKREITAAVNGRKAGVVETGAIRGRASAPHALPAVPGDLVPVVSGLCFFCIVMVEIVAHGNRNPGLGLGSAAGLSSRLESG